MATLKPEDYIRTEPEDWDAPGARSTPQRPAASRSPLGRLALIGVGILLVLVGIPMLILPGPGVAAIAGGIACIAAGLGFRRSSRSPFTKRPL